MDDKNDEVRWQFYLWLACLGLGVAFTTIASKLANIVASKNRSDSVDSTDTNESNS